MKVVIGIKAPKAPKREREGEKEKKREGGRDGGRERGEKKACARCKSAHIPVGLRGHTRYERHGETPCLFVGALHVFVSLRPILIFHSRPHSAQLDGADGKASLQRQEGAKWKFKGWTLRESFVY